RGRRLREEDDELLAKHKPQKTVVCACLWQTGCVAQDKEKTGDGVSSTRQLWALQTVYWSSPLATCEWGEVLVWVIGDCVSLLVCVVREVGTGSRWRCPLGQEGGVGGEVRQR